MAPTFIIFMAWLFFGGTHLLLSGSSFRNGLVKKYGIKTFTLIFMLVTVISLLGLIVAVWVYGDEGALNYEIAAHPIVAGLLKVIGFLGFTLMVAGLINYPRSPMAKLATQQGRAQGENDIRLKPASEIERVIRHPFFFGLAVLMAVHTLMADTLAMAVYFLGFVVLAGVGIPLQDRKLRQKWHGTYQSFESETSNLPFKSSFRFDTVKPSAWRRGCLIIIISAIFLSVGHPILMLANGVVFSLAIMAFGLLMVFKALLSSQS